MTAPDVNVLVAASRDDHPNFQVARRWLDQAVIECGVGGSIELLPMVIAGFLRLTTHPKVFAVQRRSATPLRSSTPC